MQSDFTIKPISETSVVHPVRPLTPLEFKLSEAREIAPRKTASVSSEKGDDGERKNVEQLQDFFAANGMTLKFSRDDKTNQVVVELIDQQTGEAVRQIPSDISLKLTAEFQKMQGQLFSKKV